MSAAASRPARRWPERAHRLAARCDWAAIDAGCACLLAADLVLEAVLAHGVPDSGRLPTVLAVSPFVAPVAVRRRWPRGALLGATGVALIQQIVHGQLFTTLPSESSEFVPILCSYGIGAWTDLRRGLAALIPAGAMIYGVALIATAQRAPGAMSWGADLGVLPFFIVGPWAVGCLVRERNRQADAVAALEAQTVAEREERERAAVAEERAMIGRELQDIIAHSVSMMVVQAGGARQSLPGRPDRARDSILAIERTGREALAEMRRLLGVLRRDDDPRALAPQPGLDQLPELLQGVGDRGVSCTLGPIEVEPLTPGVDLVAYRVVEAVLDGTAACGGGRAEITARCRGGTLELSVRLCDVGTGGRLVLSEHVRAVSERVAIYDGRLQVEDAVDPSPAGVLVSCRLPLGSAVLS